MTEPTTSRESAPAPVDPGASTAMPSYPVAAASTVRPSAHLWLAQGERIDDFEIVDVLGEGAFGQVYLARQLSLDRPVALKVTLHRGDEARTLARLEHDHIVTVYSESIAEARGLRLLCMQYVPGTTLLRIIHLLRERERRTWCGRMLLEVLDTLSVRPAIFHPAALRDRELLAGADYFEAVCWIGARLAEAIDYAHARGVVHRDIKPANVLVNSYGRPLLADFNIALADQQPPEGAACGGTLGYMAPEHLDAFNPETEPGTRVVDERSDIYSLGVVLYELLIGSRPFSQDVPEENERVRLLIMAAERRRAVPGPRREWADVPALLDRAVRRCLAPEPAHRYQTGAALAQALEGCRAQRRLERSLPATGPLTRAAQLRPFLWLALLALLPHALGSLVNISYNTFQIAESLRPDQQAVFAQLVVAYNLVVYPVCLVILFRLVIPGVRAWRRLHEPEVDDCEVSAARRRVLSWPVWAVGLACVGWLPGGLIFPLGLDIFASPVSASVFGHFLISFTISGVIALTYSYFGVEFLVLRVLYPRLWVDATHMPRTMATELAGRGARLRLFQLSAGLIPLIGAILLIAAGPEFGVPGFRLLVAGLLCAGMAGFGLALFAGSLLTRTLALYTPPSVPE